MVDVYAAKFEGRYPIVATAGEEVPMRTFSEFFNPKSGTFWKTIGQLNRLRDGFKYEDRSLVQFSTEYDECVKRSELFRTALYGKEAEIIELPLELQFQHRTAVGEVVLSIGDKRLSSMDDPDKRGVLIWSEASPKGAKIQIRHDGSDWDGIDTFKDNDWGLLRLFVAGGLEGKGEKYFECTWTIIVTVSGQKVPRYADCSIRVAKKECPFMPGFFTEFKVPGRMGRP